MKRIIAAVIFGAALVQALAAQTYDRAALWQKEIDALAEIDRRQTPPRDAVLFVGSSSIRMWSSLRQDFPRLAVVNRGFGGSHLEDVNHFFDRLVTPFQARQIVLYAGENDVAAGKTPERVLADFQTFLALVREKSPRSKIYYVSLKPSPARWNLREKYERANRLIKAECEKTGATFIDVWPAMLNAQGEPMPEIFIGDKLHMNPNGYAIWRTVVGKHLK